MTMLLLWLACTTPIGHAWQRSQPMYEGNGQTCLDDCSQFGLDISGNYKNYSEVPNGKLWLDTDGNAIQAQGGGFILVDSTYYWAGQDRTPYISGLPASESLVNLYSSQDLLNWDKVGSILTVHTPDVHGNQLLTYCKIERPKLVYNAKTRKFVLWAHWEQHTGYSASHVITATATQVEGPYTVTAQGHRRPGAGNKGAAAMGDRIGSLIIDYNSAAKDDNDKTHPMVPVAEAGYPPTILQYRPPRPEDPDSMQFVSASDYGTAQMGNPWTYQLNNVHFKLIVKAVAVNMTAYDTTYYHKYSDRYKISAANYIVRYPTTVRSSVTTNTFTIGDPGQARTELVAPTIHPGVSESSSRSVVYVKSGDAAFVTVTTTAASIYYSTDGTDPHTGGKLYVPGTRIALSGPAGTKTVVKAISSLNNRTSSVSARTYQVAADASSVPIFAPVFSFPSGTYSTTAAAFGWKMMRVYSPSYGANCYYTMDGLDPEPPQLGSNVGYGSRDMTVWKDDKSGSAYLISAQDNIFGRLWQLTDDFSDVDPKMEYDVWTDVSREAPALVRHGGAQGKYVYMLTSTQSGYFPNQGQYKRTSDIAAGFKRPRDKVTGYRDGASVWSKLQPFADASTFYSQPTFVLNIGSDKQPSYVYIGDRYDAVTAMGDRSTFVWMPLTIDDNAPSEAGEKGSGYLQVQFEPSLRISVSRKTVDPPPWRLLSLNQPVIASAAKQLTPEQVAAGTFNFSAAAANDGIDYDVDVYDDVKHYYQPTAVPFYWRVDLGAVFDLDWIGLSFMSVGGSDAVDRYAVLGSVDGKRWIQLVDASAGLHAGYQNHDLDGSYRYVQLNGLSVWDVDHNKEADWEVGVYQVSVYGH